MATSTGATPAYLLAPEVSALLWYMPDQRHHMLFATMWNTGSRIGEARTLTPESFDLDGLRPFVRVLSEKVRARRGRPPKDKVRLVPLTDGSFVRQMESWMLPPWPFPLPLTVEMPRRSFAPCHRPAEIVGQAAGALPLSEGDKDKRIPDEAESVSRF